jgi:hypothetical protein
MTEGKMATMALPQPPDDASRRFIEETYALFFERAAWPSFLGVHDRLDRRHDLDAEEVLRAMPPGLIFGPSGPTAYVRDEDEMALTVAALQAVPQAAEDRGLFL